MDARLARSAFSNSSQGTNDLAEHVQQTYLDDVGGDTQSIASRGMTSFSHRLGKALPSLPEPADMQDCEMEPPPTPGPSSFAPRPVHRPHNNAGASTGRGLSLVIPDEGAAYGSLHRLPPTSAAWIRNDDQHGPGQPTSATQPLGFLSPPKPRAGRKRPSKLTLMPPSTFTEAGSSSRSVPSSPSVSGRPPPQLRDKSGSEGPSPGTTRDLSSALRGTPRRRPSMPFQTKAKQVDFEYNDPGSSHNRPPEAFRDPSEHILSGKGSTLQHARSVYSQGPVEVLPGLFLGDEHNARDNEMLSDLGITTVLNVAKETVLPFQLEGNNSPLLLKSSAQWAEPSRPHQPQAVVRLRKDSDEYFTPPTTAYPQPQELAQAGASPPGNPPLPLRGDVHDPNETSSETMTKSTSGSLLRNTSSTPNLLSRFMKSSTAASAPVEADQEQTRSAREHDSSAERNTTMASSLLRYSSQHCGSAGSSDEAFDAASSPSSRAETCDSSATELTPPALNSSGASSDSVKAYLGGAGAPPSAFVATAEHHGEDCSSVTSVKLPWNATALKVPASPFSSRMGDLRYIKLPWTHDETDLAAVNGGFTHGCAIIAEALGIDSRVWNPATIGEDTSVLPLLFQGDRVDKLQSVQNKGKVLVHCQCGVSRSATLVIAFVMQAAALRYGFEESRGLMGMHDCYNMVKEKSASISPNISLIYQLVEWERQLSKAASKLREALGGAMLNASAELPESKAAAAIQDACDGRPGWSVEVMDEEKWSQMRLQEEEKEAEEETKRRNQRLEEAKRAVAERKAASDRLEGKTQENARIAGSAEGAIGSSLLQRRRKAAPKLQLETGSKSTSTVGLTSKPRPPMLQLHSRSDGAPHDVEDQDVETPFLTATTSAWRSQTIEAVGSGSLGELDNDTAMDMCAPDVGSAFAQPAGLAAANGSAMQLGGASAIKSPVPRPARPSSMSGLVSGPHPSMDALQRVSVPMATSLSSMSGMARFSFGGRGGSVTPIGKRRPGSMAAGTGTFPPSSGLFGAAAQTKEERRKQHRRTFSSDLPALRAGLDLDKLVIPTPVKGPSTGPARDVGADGLTGSMPRSETLRALHR